MSTDPSVITALESLAFVAITAALGGGLATALALRHRPNVKRRARRSVFASSVGVRCRKRPHASVSLAARVNLARIIL